jgi:hypothetical protein
VNRCGALAVRRVPPTSASTTAVLAATKITIAVDAQQLRSSRMLMVA